MVGKYHLKGLGIGGFTRRRPVNNFTTDLSSSPSMMMNTGPTDTPLKTVKTTTTAKIPSKRRRIEVDDDDDDDDVDSDNDDVDLKELENDDDTNDNTRISRRVTIVTQCHNCDALCHNCDILFVKMLELGSEIIPKN